MGRHAAPPPRRRASSRASQIPGRGTSTATAGFLVAGTAAALSVATVLGIAAAGIDLAPRAQSAAAAAPTPGASAARVAITSSPAQAAISTTLADSPARGWTPASALTWAGGTPFDATCGRPSPDSALAGTRIYAVGRRQVVATVSAYSAGAGPVAFAAWARLLGTCAGPVSRTTTTVPLATAGAVRSAAGAAPATAEAFVAWIGPTAGRPGAASLFWRRGDVVAVLSTPSTSTDGLAAAAISLDGALLTALQGRCADLASTLADAARSPWVAGVDFTGLTVPVAVSAAPSPLPPAPAGSTPVPPGWTPSPLPSISFPARPVDPVWPLDLPTQVASPLAPQSPSAAPTMTVVPSRTTDPVGPGCGWGFAGQPEPPIDPQAEAAKAEAAVAQAQQDLVGAQSLYVSDVLAYWQQVPVYEQAAATFAAYAAAVRSVADAWGTIQRQRDDYAAALVAYDAAIAARNAFLGQQALAQTEYDAARDTCLAVTAPPTSGPTPTGPAPTLTPGPTDTATPAPTDTPTAPGCPPLRPAILDQAPPDLPLVPTPPPDPVPVPSPTR